MLAAAGVEWRFRLSIVALPADALNFHTDTRPRGSNAVTGRRSTTSTMAGGALRAPSAALDVSCGAL